MKVAICQKATLFRDALATVVTSRGHDVVSCVSSISEAAQAFEHCSADVMLLDASLSDVESLARLRQELDLRVLLLTTTGEDPGATAALEAGLADAIFDDAVALVTLERAVNGQLSSSWTRKPVPQKERRTVSTLTARESEVMGLLVAGRSTEAIASALGVSRSTVHSHVQSVLLKLGARSRIEAVSIYLDGTTALTREHPARPAAGY